MYPQGGMLLMGFQVGGETVPLFGVKQVPDCTCIGGLAKNAKWLEKRVHWCFLCQVVRETKSYSRMVPNSLAVGHNVVKCAAVDGAIGDPGGPALLLQLHIKQRGAQVQALAIDNWLYSLLQTHSKVLRSRQATCCCLRVPSWIFNSA